MNFANRRWFALAVGLAAGLLAAAPRAGAQAPQTDPRWQPWLGCWAPVAAQKTPTRGAPTQALLVCVVPVSGAAGVDFATVSDTDVVARDRLDASGERRPVEREGCAGWEAAQWSSDGARAYVRSELTCQGNFRRRSSGVMALTPEGEWLDVRAVTAGSQRGVRVLRYQPVPLPENLPTDIAAALRGAGWLRAAAPAAPTAEISTADIAEASHQLDPDVVEAWLAESDQQFHMNAARLLEAKRAGIPGDVVDVMVALSYPRVFTINPASREAEFRAPPEGARTAADYGYGGAGYSWGGYYYSPYGWDSWWPYGWGMYNPMYGYSPYGPYGYAPWYGGYGGWYGGWYYGGGGGVLIVTGSGASADHGQVVKGRGYTQGGGSTGRGAQPRGTPSARPQGYPEGRRATGGDRGSSAGASQPSSGGSQPRSQPSSGGSSSGSSGGRTAKPRPPR
jgi:hypothetical protein